MKRLIFLFLLLPFWLWGVTGDIDNNGGVDIADALKIAQVYVGLTINLPALQEGDVNYDGAVDITDTLMVAQYHAGLLSGFPAPPYTIIYDDFTEGYGSWYFITLERANAKLSITDEPGMNGPGALRVDIKKSGTKDWNIELKQIFTMSAGGDYAITFLARAEKPRSITLKIQQDYDPWSSYKEWSVELTKTPRTYGPYTFTSLWNDSDTRLLFALGEDNGDVILDSIRLTGQFSAPTPEPSFTPEPTMIPGSNPETDRVKVLDYITTLTSREDNRVLSGQFVSHGNEITRDYKKYITRLEQETGSAPAMISIDYEYTNVFPLTQLLAGNIKLKEFWLAGGLISINYTARNVFTGGDTRDRDLRGGTLADMATPGTAVYETWHKRLDIIARALLDLQDMGVIVLWRPLQEANGFWFWYGTKPGFVQVWRDMHSYFETRGLKNLIWVYSVADSMYKSWISKNYPGDEYVDIIGTNIYDDDLNLNSYEALLVYGKPVAFTENGWQLDGASGDNDNRLIINRIREDYPEIRWFMNWHDWDTSNIHSITANPHAQELLNDPWTITRDEVSWR